jgi:hypothetical protein
MLFGQFEKTAEGSVLTFGGRFCSIGRFFLCWKDEKPESFHELGES